MNLRSSPGTNLYSLGSILRNLTTNLRSLVSIRIFRLPKSECTNDENLNPSMADDTA